MKNLVRWWFVMGVLGVASACDPAAAPFDSGLGPDIGPRAPDAGVSDAGPAPDAGARPDAGPPIPVPESLSETGLYSDFTSETIADRVLEYRPEYELWSDGAEKRRWIYIPPDTRIDTTDMDAWVFPVGTKGFKEFTRDGTRIETRMLWKAAATTWIHATYRWNEAQTEALRLPEGETNALGTDHDVPSEFDCETCHQGASDTLIGVSAILLDHDLGGTTLADLASREWLSDAPLGSLDLPWAPRVADVLGYFHVNCGNCHNDSLTLNPLRLWLTVDALALPPEDTPSYLTLVDRPQRAENRPAGTSADRLVDPGDPENSILWVRMARRGEFSGQMPPLGSELVDLSALPQIEAWIRALR